MPNPVDVTVKASGSIAATGNGASIDLDGLTVADTLKRRLVRLMLEVTAVASVSPTIAITIQTSPNATSWEDVLAFDTTSILGFQRLCFAPLERYIRAKWTITAKSAVFTADNTTEFCTSAAHGLVNGDQITVSNTGGALPAPLVAATPYVVANKTLNTFQLTLGGAPIDLTTNGTGIQTFALVTSFTIAITGEAHVIYASNEDFYRYGLPQKATLDQDPIDLLSRILLASSSYANGRIPKAYKLPLVQPVPDSLIAKVCEHAAYKFLSVRGFDSDDPADKEVKTTHDDAVKWFDSLGKGVVPDWVDATPTVTEFGAACVSQARRGW